MSRDLDDSFMWDGNGSDVIQQLNDFRCRVSSQPPLQVHIPKRNIKVPQQKTKKLMEVLSKPREHQDPTASLLMIAPLSDERYRYLMKEEQPCRCPTMTRQNLAQLSVTQPNIAQSSVTRPNVAQSSVTQPNVAQSSVTQPNIAQSSVTRPNVAQLSATQPNIAQSSVTRPNIAQSSVNSRTLLHVQSSLPGKEIQRTTSSSSKNVPVPHFSGANYLQQLSALAAMAWSDCTEVTEKLRRIYEHTASLTADSYPGVASSQSLLRHKPAIEVYNQSQQTESTKPRQLAGVFRLPPACEYLENIATPTSALCPCVLCEMARRAQPGATMHGDVTSYAMTSRIVANDPLLRAATDHCQDFGHTRARTKRKLSPDDFAPNQPPFKRQFNAQYQTFSSRLAVSSSFPSCSVVDPPIHCGPTNPHVPNLYVPPHMGMTSSASMKSCDLMATPSLERHCYLNDHQMSGRVHTAGRPYNHFNHIIPTHVPNVIK